MESIRNLLRNCTLWDMYLPVVSSSKVRTPLELETRFSTSERSIHPTLTADSIERNVTKVRRRDLAEVTGWAASEYHAEFLRVSDINRASLTWHKVFRETAVGAQRIIRYFWKKKLKKLNGLIKDIFPLLRTYQGRTFPTKSLIRSEF